MRSMKIKQQQQIRSFLIREFGEEKGRTLFAQQESKLDAIIAGTANKTTNQMKTLTQTILPRIVMYKALLDSWQVEGPEMRRRQQ